MGPGWGVTQLAMDRRARDYEEVQYCNDGQGHSGWTGTEEKTERKVKRVGRKPVSQGFGGPTRLM